MREPSHGSVTSSCNFLSGIPFRIAKHWIAGENLEDALARARHSNASNVRGIVNLLGEEVASQE